jgi:prepilin-type N-terminal cleavage/methylation domain-containing protein
MSKKGFTMIELLVVIIIIGIVAVMVIPKLFNNTTKSKASEVASTLNAIEKTLVMEKKANFINMKDVNGDGNYLDDMVNDGKIQCRNLDDGSGGVRVECSNSLSDQAKWEVLRLEEEDGSIAYYAKVSSTASTDKKVLDLVEQIFNGETAVYIEQ